MPEAQPIPLHRQAPDPAIIAALVESRASRKRRRTFGALFVLLLCTSTGYGIYRWHSRVPAPAYELGVATRNDLSLIVTATGTLEARKTVEVGTEVTGRIVSIEVNENDPVNKGQELATIDPEQLRASKEQSSAELSAAQAAVLEARASAEETSLAATRAEEQGKRGLISAQQLEAARAANLRAKAALSNARARTGLSRASLGLAIAKLEKTKILSPIDGIVLSRNVELGQTVTAGFQTPVLFKLAENLAQMRLVVAVDEADIGRVREGLSATFTVDAYPEREFSSRVISVRNSPRVSQNVVTYEAMLEVDNAEHLLRPGMTATSRIVSETLKSVLVVPNEAFRFAPPVHPGQKLAVAPKGPRERRLFVLSGTTPRPVVVKVGKSDGNVTVVESGNLAPGTRVILDIIGAQ